MGTRIVTMDEAERTQCDLCKRYIVGEKHLKMEDGTTEEHGYVDCFPLKERHVCLDCGKAIVVATENFDRAWYGKEPKGEEEKKTKIEFSPVPLGPIGRALDRWHDEFPDNPPDAIRVGQGVYLFLREEFRFKDCLGSEEMKFMGIPVIQSAGIPFGDGWGFVVKDESSDPPGGETFISISNPDGSIDFAEMESYLKKRTGKP